MSNEDSRGIYHSIVNWIDRQHKPVHIVLEALELATKEFEDRQSVADGVVSFWRAGDPIDKVNFSGV